MTRTDVKTAEVMLVRYGELALKGGNRAVFERALVRNIKSACEPIPVRIERQRGRMVVYAETRPREVAARLQQVFGIVSVSPARHVPSDPEQIADAACLAMNEALAAYPPERTVTFRVKARRAEKRFPLTSTALNLFVAERVIPAHPNLKVQLKHPELTLGIEVPSSGTFVFAESLPGPGGLPVGTLGRALCLLSGGIDSPVAAWYAMKRGCAVRYVSFHSYPYIGESSKRKLVQLVRALSRWQPTSELYVVPFTEVQEAVRDHTPSPYRTVLYRRFMQRIASRLARRLDAGVLITGESLGQVASQTMENLTCIGSASELPVLRPLICYDKQETIAVAQRIGTFATSIVPEPDCCTVFMPDRPIIRGKLSECLSAEERLDVEGLVARALAGVEKIVV